jgi:hypothetical protein
MITYLVVRVSFPFRRSFILVTIFSLVCPLGIAIGLGLDNLSDDAQDLVSSILNGLAVGVFLYISILGVVSFSTV